MSVDQAKDGRSELRWQLNGRFRAPLMAYFLRRVGSRTEAEDLTQEVFVRLLGAANLDRLEHVEAFVFRVAANLLHDRGRKAIRGRTTAEVTAGEALIEELALEMGEDFEPERVLIGKQTIVEVLKCLNELGERTRNIFILFRLEGMKQREIANLYGISPSTVEKHVMKAAAHLSLRFG